MGFWEFLGDVAEGALEYQSIVANENAEYVDKGIRCYKNGNYNEAFRYFKMAAERNNSNAMYNLALCYRYGEGTDMDYEEAVYWYRKAAEKGVSGAKEAIDEIGSDTGCLIQKDDLFAIRKGYITKFSLSNVSYSWNGNNYTDRKVTIKIGRLQNESAHHSGSVKLMFWYCKTAYNGDHLDGTLMAEDVYSSSGSRGNCYGWSDIEFVMDMDGNPPTGDYFPILTVNELDEDGSWYIVGYCNFDKKQHWNQEEEIMSTDELTSLAEEHWNNEEYEEAAELYLEAAEQGDAYAQYAIGFCYDNGTGTNQDYRKALKWYRKAAEQENADAQYSLGCCYLLGNGVEKCEKEGVRWFRKAAEQGHAGAQCALGYCYEKGIGIEQSYNEAVKLYRMAAEQGYAIAQNNLGACYGEGHGVEQSYTEALKWYNKSIEQECDVAYANLGEYYEKGNGVPKDYNKALEFYNLAFEKGYENAKEGIDRVSAILNGGNVESTATHSDNEQEYIETLKEIIADDGEITDRERRLLEKLRTKLGISESRAKELEDALANPSLTAEEQEYLDEYKSIAADGKITDKERKLLDKIRKMSGISEERAREIEKMA